ncbi:NAD-dependent succinate-semialdehyde dehydrogenase [Dyella sp. C11]|uniref:NAD-dependent succinate-semialdehyde dehydrogenase n=1 Tax=Dyella sp. C11 TaxID=2126991 RepID=UPI000D643B1D|nr:NAD-dependent succinate-semialdehyde dehydrogenase [Dyella sp. C11]
MPAQPSTAAPLSAESRDPATGKLIKAYPFTTEAELESLLERTRAGFHRWRFSTLEQRSKVLRSMADALRKHKEEMALLATTEMGRTLNEARAEIDKCAWLCEWNADNAPTFLKDEPTQVPDGKAYVSFLPLGTVLAVMPWNMPYWQAMRSAVPILSGGNGYLLKPAENVVGCALLLQKVWEEAGLPKDTFIAANLSRPHVAQAIGDNRIAGVTVTGSVNAGRAISTAASQAVKKAVLELGGSDPYIVLADADLDLAAETAVTARFQNAGQVCIAAKRIIVESSAYSEFVEKFLSGVRKLVVGDSRKMQCDLGPMARLDLLEQLDGQVKASVKAGAELLEGGKRVGVEGAFYAPTVLGRVKPGMAAFDTETFGPLAAIIEARDADHAVELANHSEYGLSGNVWSRDIERAKALARRLETGGVFINGFSASDPRVPIGGVKKSGYGRELSHFGLREFVNAQTVWVDRRG